MSISGFLEDEEFAKSSILDVLAAGDMGAKYALGLPGLGILMLGPMLFSGIDTMLLNPVALLRFSLGNISV